MRIIENLKRSKKKYCENLEAACNQYIDILQIEAAINTASMAPKEWQKEIYEEVLIQNKSEEKKPFFRAAAESRIYHDMFFLGKLKYNFYKKFLADL